MSEVFNKLLLITGFVLLIHAAYSAAQRKLYMTVQGILIIRMNKNVMFTDRTYLRITEQEDTFLPIDVNILFIDLNLI